LLHPGMIGSTALSILVVYVVANLMDLLQNFLAAKQMTEELLKFQGKNSEVIN